MENVQEMAQQSPNDDVNNCVICWELCTEPFFLPCGHSFCASCIEQWKRHGVRSGIGFLCPLCRHIVLPPNSDFKNGDVEAPIDLALFSRVPVTELLTRVIDNLMMIGCFNAPVNHNTSNPRLLVNNVTEEQNMTTTGQSIQNNNQAEMDVQPQQLQFGIREFYDIEMNESLPTGVSAFNTNVVPN